MSEDIKTPVNNKQGIRGQYIVTCPACNGRKKIPKRIGKGTAMTLQLCDTCKGLGHVTYSKDFCMFKVMELNRKINFHWESIKHLKPIPESYMWEIDHDCPVCKGKGETVKIENDTYITESCIACKGNGYTDKAIKKVFIKMFKTFVRLKEERDIFNNFIQYEVWKRPEVKFIQKLKPKKYIVVCTRCKHYLSEDKDAPCNECCNSAVLNAPCKFEAITKEANRWYKQDGHKWNFNGKF